MRPDYRAWTDEEWIVLADLLAAGAPKEDIAERLDRSVEAIAIRSKRIICPIDGGKPAWGKRPYGAKLYWTKERTLAGLQDFARRNRGPLPTSDHIYSDIKKGHAEWPTAGTVLHYFGSMARAWAAAGVSRQRYHLSWTAWTEEEDEYLLEHAGEETLKVIAAHLGRTWSACKRRLYDLRAGRARDVPGWLSAAQVAKEYGAPLSRVIHLIESGTLPAFKVRGGHYWRVNPIDADHIRDLLSAPKKRSYKGIPPDIGDYERRYGLRRQRIDGRVVRVPVKPLVRLEPTS